MGILTGMSQVEQRQLSQRLEQEMREMAAASSSEQKHHQEEARAAVAGAAAELKALESQPAPAPAPAPAPSGSGPPPLPTQQERAQMEATAVAILQQQVTNVRRVVAEKAEKDQQLGVMHARMELLRTENEEEKENLRTARQREAQMAATVDEERRAAEQAREWGESVQQDADKKHAAMNEELRVARNTVARLKESLEKVSKELETTEAARKQEAQLASAQAVRVAKTHKAELVKLQAEGKSRAEEAKAAADAEMDQLRKAAASDMARLKDEHLDELRATQKECDARISRAKDEFAEPIKAAQKMAEEAERKMAETLIECERRSFETERTAGEAQLALEQKHSEQLTNLRGECDARVSAAVAEGEAKLRESRRAAEDKLAESIQRMETRRLEAEKKHDERVNELTTSLAEATRQAFEDEVAAHQRTSQSWSAVAQKERDERQKMAAQHDQALADAARESAESTIAAHVRVRAEEASANAAQFARMEKEKAATQTKLTQLTDQLVEEHDRNARQRQADTASLAKERREREAADSKVEELTRRLQSQSEVQIQQASIQEADRNARVRLSEEEAVLRLERDKEKLQREKDEVARGKDEADSKVAELTRRLLEQTEASAQLQQTTRDLVYGKAGEPLADAEIQRLRAEKMNLQKQMDLLQARVDSATSRKGEFNKKQQETISELEGKVFELEKQLVSRSKPEAELKQQVEESQDELRMVSRKKDAELESLRDSLRRQEGTVAALEAQLACRDPAGSMSDPEREALLEGKRVAERRVADVEAERDAEVDRLKDSLRQQRTAAEVRLTQVESEMRQGMASLSAPQPGADAERAALVEGKRAADANAARIESELQLKLKALSSELEESREEVRFMSAKKDAELESLRDSLRRQEGTVAALEAQLASPAGSMSDPEREALLEGKRVAERRVAEVEAEMVRNMEALSTEIAESRMAGREKEAEMRQEAQALSAELEESRDLAAAAARESQSEADALQESLRRRQSEAAERLAQMEAQLREAQSGATAAAPPAQQSAQPQTSSAEREALLERVARAESEMSRTEQSLELELAAARDQIRSLSNQEHAEADLLKRQQSTIEALETQLANRNPSGQLSDPEREALVARNREAEERIVSLESEMARQMEAMSLELVEARDQVRLLSSKEHAESDLLKRDETTIVALEAQLASRDLGHLSDPEREALLEGKRAAEERIVELESETRENVEALSLELAEAHDHVRALSSKEHAEADLLKRQQSTIDALEAQIGSDGFGFSDAEREALLARSRSAEARVEAVESEMAQNTDALSLELAEARDQIRSLSSRVHAESDMLKRHEATIARLKTQLENHDPSGRMKDAERDALVESNRISEGRIAELESEMAQNTETLSLELAEARDQVRALSSKENAEADLLKRQQSTIDALEAQIASDGSSGQIGDAERQALKEGKLAAEARIAELESESRENMEAVSRELAEARDQVRALSTKEHADSDLLKRRDSAIEGLQQTLAAAESEKERVLAAETEKDAEIGSLTDSLRRQEGAVAALEVQLASRSTSDSEREALLESKRAAEQRTAEVEAEMVRNMESLSESRDELRLLSEQKQAEFEAERQALMDSKRAAEFESQKLKLEMQHLRDTAGSGIEARGSLESLSSIDSRSNESDDHTELSQEIGRLKERLRQADERHASTSAARDRKSDKTAAMRRRYEEQVGALQEQLAASADESRLSESKVEQLEEEVSALHAQLESLLEQSNALQKDKSASDDAVRKQQSELINLRTQLLQRGDSDGAPQSFLVAA